MSPCYCWPHVNSPFLLLTDRFVFQLLSLTRTCGEAAIVNCKPVHHSLDSGSRSQSQSLSLLPPPTSLSDLAATANPVLILSHGFNKTFHTNSLIPCTLCLISHFLGLTVIFFYTINFLHTYFHDLISHTNHFSNAENCLILNSEISHLQMVVLDNLHRFPVHTFTHGFGHSVCPC